MNSTDRSPKQPARLGRSLPTFRIAAAGAGVFASFLLAGVVLRQDHRIFEAEFTSRAEERARIIESALHSALELVESTAALYAASDTVDRDQFRVFASSVLESHSGLHALGYDAVISRSERAGHEASVRLDGFPDYRITEKAADGRLVPAADRDVHVVVVFIEPNETNQAAIGYDIASEPVRREALIRARDTGEAAITGRIRLVQETGEQFGALICAPVYSGRHPETPEERRASLVGYAVGVVRIADIISEAVASLRPTGIHLLLTDDSAPEELSRLHLHVSRTLRDARPTSEFASETSFEERVEYGFEIAGRHWTVHAAPTAAYLSGRTSWVPAGVLSSGLMVTALLVSYVSWQGSVNRRLSRAIAERERAEERQASFGRMLDESHDEIYVFDAGTLRFVHVNLGAASRLLELSSEGVGRCWRSTPERAYLR